MLVLPSPLTSCCSSIAKVFPHNVPILCITGTLMSQDRLCLAVQGIQACGSSQPASSKGPVLLQQHTCFGKPLMKPTHIGARNGFGSAPHHPLSRMEPLIRVREAQAVISALRKQQRLELCGGECQCLTCRTMARQLPCGWGSFW